MAGEPKRKMENVTCRHCPAVFVGFPEWLACHRYLCQAKAYWTAEQWAGAGRMALIREELGLPLSEVDAIAIRKAA